jgi:hypothetical protein
MGDAQVQWVLLHSRRRPIRLPNAVNNRKRIAQGLTVLGSIVLFASAAFHSAGGYPQISAAMHASGLQPPLVRALQAIWVMAAWHWIGIGTIALVACFARTGPRRLILLLCGLLPLVDAIAGYVSIGPFIGDEMLTVAAVAILGGLALLPNAES